MSKNHSTNKERSYFARARHRLAVHGIQENMRYGAVVRSAARYFFGGKVPDFESALRLAWKNRRAARKQKERESSVTGEAGGEQ